MIVRVLVSLDLETYLRGVVPAEMPASWPMEALRAQAVLARTYALWRMDNPVSDEFDLYGDHRSQVYDSERHHPATDQAVTATAGIYIAQPDGSPRLVEYISKCGQCSCPFCQGAPGHTTGRNPEGRWPGRVCQYGMRDLALAGQNYEEIIRAFVDNAVFQKMQ